MWVYSVCISMLTLVLLATIYLVTVLGESHINLVKDHYELRADIIAERYEMMNLFREKLTKESTVDIEILS